MKRLLAILFLLFSGMASAQQVTHNNNIASKMQFPDIPGYYTLKCDLHLHSIFSDGTVSPAIRVEEALSEGLDVIALTDHLYLYPNGEKIPSVPNGKNLLADAAKGKSLIVILGCEISTDMNDHFNALFINNLDDPLLHSKSQTVCIKAAKDQGGFVAWNHPGWLGRAVKDGNVPVNEEYYKLMEKELIKGIEVCNGKQVYLDIMELAKQYDLTILGNSDMHGKSQDEYPKPDTHRPVTLVFSKDKSVEGVREALENSRTVVYSGNCLIGKSDLLKELFLASLKVVTTYVTGTTIAEMKIENISDVDFICRNSGDLIFHNVPYVFQIPGHATTTLMIRTNKVVSTFNLDLIIENLIIGLRESLKVSMPITIQGD